MFSDKFNGLFILAVFVTAFVVKALNYLTIGILTAIRTAVKLIFHAADFYFTFCFFDVSITVSVPKFTSTAVFIRIFPHKSVTAKPLETRMGKGKAEISHWVAKVKPGTVIYEIGGVPEDVARAAFARVAHKMPIKCRFVTRRQSLV